MTAPVERLRAAIEKLEQYRGEHWGFWSEEDDPFGIIAGNPGGGREVVGPWIPRQADAELIVTLHSTIDAQLAIMRHTLAHYSGDLGISTNRHIVALADAILGHSPAPALSERELAEVARFGIHPELGEAS